MFYILFVSSFVFIGPEKPHWESSQLRDLLNRAAVGWAVSCSAFSLFCFVNRAAWGRGAVLVLHGVFFNRAAVGVRGSSFTRGLFLTARPGAEERF